MSIKRRSSKYHRTIAVEELRQRLAAKNYLDPTRLNKDTVLFRYLCYTGFNVAKAEKLIQNFYNNSEKRAETMATEVPAAFLKNHVIFGGARDSQNRPVVQIVNLARFCLANEMTKEDGQNFGLTIKKLYHLMEDACLKHNALHAVAIIDLKGVAVNWSLGMRAFKYSMDVVNQLNSTSPEVIPRIVYINAPKLIRFFVSAAQKVLRLSEEQRQNLLIFSAEDTNWKSELLKHFAIDQLVPEFGGTFKAHHLFCAGPSPEPFCYCHSETTVNLN